MGFVSLVCRWWVGLFGGLVGLVGMVDWLVGFLVGLVYRYVCLVG